jgi:probable DNA metabolism protein
MAAADPKTRLIFVVEKTFEGLLNAIFKAYETKQPPDDIQPFGQGQLKLFDRRVEITTDPVISDRVWKGLLKHLGLRRRQMLFEAYLSGQSGIETIIYRYIRHSLPAPENRQYRADLDSQIQIEKLSQKIRREAHRMKGFIRFQKTDNDQYLALIAPRYDVLPLIRRHFETRFADQRWIIYDTVRNYGLCYDRCHTQELRLNAGDLTGIDAKNLPEEQRFQKLWQRYFSAVNISQRNNPKLHLRQLPRRYWRYLTEKQAG